MNIVHSLSPACMALFGFVATCGAAVIQTPGLIQIEGVLDGSSGTPFDPSDTLDYLKFEVLVTSEVTVSGNEFSSNRRLMLAEYTGDDEEFGFVGNPYLILGKVGPQSFARTLNPGIYVIAMGTAKDTSYDIFDGFTAVNPEGGGFTIANYSYSIAGDVRALEFWDGELDGTFKITHYDVPEPSTAFLALTATLVVAVRRRRALGQGLVKGWPCGGGGLRGPAF